VAGSSNIGEASDNPVGVNAVPLVDVIFCLCLFFMCSLKFKQLEGKIETWLPKDRGVEQTPPEKIVLEEIRVFMRWQDNQTVRKVGNRAPVRPGPEGDIELMQIINQMSNDYKKLGKTEFPVLIDALGDVPWRDVIHVLDLCKMDKLERIEFAAPIEVPTKSGS
jgi:biopolymer transport protein ExbD